MPDRRVLVLYAHPNHADSHVNAALRAAAQSTGGVTVHDLYETYPHFVIDVAREKALVLEHDVLVLQFPLQWYSSPAIIKEWLDAVLEEGWAYGVGGTQLIGKPLLLAVTSGGGEPAYRADGPNRFTIAQLLRPFELTARLCGMRYLAPFVTFAARRIDRQAIQTRTHAYHTLLEQLACGELPPPFDSRLDEA
jgi:glutathione-regulated potassium-efflux system ancillary protein KefG